VPRPGSVVIADKTGIALTAAAWVDAEEFGRGGATRLYDEGDDAQSRLALAEAVNAYPGDPFDDDPYPDWTASLREQARAAHLRALRALARLARRAGDTDEALHRLLALLDLDPYDEDAHRSIVATLVAAGRHGEARRAQRRYRDAMAEIGVLPR
jgi:DNA-binding SARP family transcriptional activator